MPSNPRKHQLTESLLYHIYNRANSRTGRFKSQPIQKESYLLACGRYIERNPVKAKIAAFAEDYPYSSARYYVHGIEDNATSKDPLFPIFGDDIATQQKEYKAFLETFDSEEESLFESLEKPIGSPEFRTKLIKEKGLYLPRRRGRARKELIHN